MASEYRIISTKIKLSLEVQRKRAATPAYNRSIHKNEKKAIEYIKMVTQIYNELNNFKECNLEPYKSYEQFIIANKEASKTHLPKKRTFECPAQHADIAEPRKIVNETYKLYVI